jgi:hypothetical protein
MLGEPDDPTGRHHYYGCHGDRRGAHYKSIKERPACDFFPVRSNASAQPDIKIAGSRHWFKAAD